MTLAMRAPMSIDDGDLDDGDLNDGVVQGGYIQDLTVGLNWFLNPFAKVQFNYIAALLDNPTFGDSFTSINALRGQVEF